MVVKEVYYGSKGSQYCYLHNDGERDAQTLTNPKP
jgi:hypothetical protein